jgi:hypothetical protein
MTVCSGYTVIDNIILFNGTMNIVTDESDLFPPIQNMVLSTDLNKWRVVTPQQAREQLGPFGGRYFFLLLFRTAG